MILMIHTTHNDDLLIGLSTAPGMVASVDEAGDLTVGVATAMRPLMAAR